MTAIENNRKRHHKKHRQNRQHSDNSLSISHDADNVESEIYIPCVTPRLTDSTQCCIDLKDFDAIHNYGESSTNTTDQCEPCLERRGREATVKKAYSITSDSVAFIRDIQEGTKSNRKGSCNSVVHLSIPKLKWRQQPNLLHQSPPRTSAGYNSSSMEMSHTKKVANKARSKSRKPRRSQQQKYSCSLNSTRQFHFLKARYSSTVVHNHYNSNIMGQKTKLKSERINKTILTENRKRVSYNRLSHSLCPSLHYDFEPLLLCKLAL